MIATFKSATFGYLVSYDSVVSIDSTGKNHEVNFNCTEGLSALFAFIILEKEEFILVSVKEEEEQTK